MNMKGCYIICKNQRVDWGSGNKLPGYSQQSLRDCSVGTAENSPEFQLRAEKEKNENREHPIKKF